MKIQPIYLDLCPAYIPFLVQCTKADGDKADPSADALIIYEEGGADGTFDATTITGSPFDPAKVNSKTGLWGVLVDKTKLTAGKFYICLWEMTVDSKTTAKVEVFFATNASSFKADVSGITGIISDSKISAAVKAIDDIDFSNTMLSSIESSVVNAINTATPATITPDSLYEQVGDIADLVSDGAIASRITGIESEVDLSEAMITSLESSVVNAINTAAPVTITEGSLYDKIDEIMGDGFNTDNDSLHILRNRGDEYWKTGDVGSIPTVPDIVSGLEEEGTKIDAVFQTVGAFLDTTVSSRASLGDGNIEVTFEVTNDATDAPVADVLVQVRAVADITTAVIASGYTNDSGQVKFRLNSNNTYYFYRRKAGMVFTDPVEVAVSE